MINKIKEWYYRKIAEKSFWNADYRHKILGAKKK